jgi:ketosteroid isomerase-like protein
MSQHVSISPAEAADRLAIRELVEAYAHCADRRDAKGQLALLTEDTHFVVYSRMALAAVRNANS